MLYGRRIAELRGERKINQRELADILRIAKSTVSMYEQEKREPDLEIFVKIAYFFDVSIDYLVGVSSQRGRFEHSLIVSDEAERELVESYRALDSVGRSEVRGFIRGYRVGVNKTI